MGNLEQRVAEPPHETKPRGWFLSNICDHRKPYAELMHVYSLHARNDREAMQREWQHHLDWINQNEIRRPKATTRYTVEELEKMGMIGIYAKETAI